MIDGRVPAQSALGECEPHVALEMLRHLLVYWAPQPPERKAPRHSVKTRLSVTHGYSGVLDVLGGGDSLDFDNQNTESWIVENVSAGGFGAVVPQLKGDWLRVGALLALQPEGGSNWLLGLVRRVTRTTGQQARVGIETVSRAPVHSRFAVSGALTASEQGVLLADVEPGAKVRILRFENEAEEILHYLRDAGLAPELEGTLESSDGDEVVLASADGSHAISRSVAETVSVKADPSPPSRPPLPEQLVLSSDRYGR